MRCTHVEVLENKRGGLNPSFSTGASNTAENKVLELFTALFV